VYPRQQVVKLGILQLDVSFDFSILIRSLKL